MKFILEVNNKTTQKFSKNFFMSVFQRSLELANVACLENKTLELSVAFVSEDEIRKINKEYRKKDQSTDVLSFSEYANISDLCDNEGNDIFLGEIIICPDFLKKSAKEQGVSFEFELAYIFSHGILHLLDFSHGEKMFSLQEEVAKKIIK